MTLVDYINIETTRDDLIRACKQAADLIRTRVDHEYILVLLFLKRLNNKWKREYYEALKTLLEKGLSEEEIDVTEEWEESKEIEKEISDVKEKLHLIYLNSTTT